MLQFVFGRAGSGKTYTIHEEIRRDVAAGRQDVILLVPEQYTFETEREMLSLFGDGFMSMVSVLSFTRLCEAAGQRYGGIAGLRVSDAQRLILLGNCMKKLSGHLTMFRKYATSPVFIKQLASAIGEFKNAGVSGAELMRVADTVTTQPLHDKLCEIAMIYAAYDDALKGIYIDPLDELERFYQKALQHDYFDGKTVYIDAFKGFTGAQLKILRLMITKAKRVVISACAEPKDRMNGVGIFSNINETVARLITYAEDQHVLVEEPIVLTGAHGREPALCDLERLLAGELVQPPAEPPTSVSLLRFENPLHELEFVFKTIHRLVRTKGYRYADFVVIARDITKYERRISLAAEKFEVPYFLDQRRGLMTSPVARFVLSFLRAADRLSTEAIFSLLKTGFFGLNRDEIARLEEYVYIWNIDRDGWLKEWDMEPNGLVAEQQGNVEKTAKVLADLNQLRCRVTEPLARLKKALLGTVPTACEGIFQGMLAVGCDDAVKKYCETLIAKNSGDDADFVIDSWDAVVSVLDDMVRCYGEEVLPPATLIQMIELAFSGLTLGTLPRMIDEVSCGSADRIRPGRPKVTFVIGLGMGEFPAPVSEQGLLLKSDRLRLEEAGIDISDQFRKFAIEEAFLAYTALCSATEQVYATCHAFSFDGSPVEESAIYSKIKAVFGEKSPAKDQNELPETAAEGFDRLAAGFDQTNATTAGLRKYFEEHPEYRFRVSALKAAEQKKSRRLSPEVSEMLFHDGISLSASKIEVYRKCPFSYFCKYVLRLQKLQKAELDQLQRGTIVHHVLETVLAALGERIGVADSEEIKSLISKAMRQYLDQIRGVSYLEVPRFRFLFDEIEKMLGYLIGHISAEFQNSDFVPKAFELNISDDGDVPALRLTFSPGKEVTVVGQIDRVDMFEKENGTPFVRVVDYKTGKKSFYLSDVLYGLNLQMLLYLYILRRNGVGDLHHQPIAPAGILYMPSNRGMIGTDGSDPLVMNGMLLDDADVLRAMDKQETGRFVPKRPTRERAADPMISAEEFETVFRYVEHQVKDTAMRISDGIFDLCPRDGTESTACKYCDFAAVCGVEEDFARLQTKKQANRAVLEQMKEVVEDGNQMD